MSWAIEEHIGEGRPWPAQVVVYRGETSESLAYVSGEVADRLKAENAKLVRCRDCRYWVEDPRPIDPGWTMMCEDSGRDMVGPDDFCAWGERKDV